MSKALLRIGYTSLLLPDVKTATKVCDLLSGALHVHDKIYMNILELREECDIGMSIVSDKVIIVNENGDPAPGRSVQRRNVNQRQLPSHALSISEYL
jgi:hypothetical protein